VAGCDSQVLTYGGFNVKMTETKAIT